MQRIVDAAAELVRERSFATLTVDELMAAAGIGRTLFYRHFDDLGDLLLRAGQRGDRRALRRAGGRSPAVATASARTTSAEAIEAAVGVYRRHGPVLRAVAEAAADDERVAAGPGRAFAGASTSSSPLALRDAAADREPPLADFDETARALNLMNENYLLDAFGREPRVSEETALRTLTEIWVAVISG